ncbi:MAG: hypothetical protein KDB14_24510 [Planctomycetales bacterium]|nr:hypothetical protein [Planctomycetales bacterium]
MFALALGLTLSAAASAQVNHLRGDLREPRALPAFEDGTPIKGIHTPTATEREDSATISQSMVRTAVFQRALSARQGNSIRLTSGVSEVRDRAADEAAKSSGTALRWVDPAKPGRKLSDQPANGWVVRGESFDERRPGDAMSAPFSTESRATESQATDSQPLDASFAFGSPAPAAKAALEPAYTSRQIAPFDEPGGRGAAEAIQPEALGQPEALDPPASGDLPPLRADQPFDDAPMPPAGAPENEFGADPDAAPAPGAELLNERDNRLPAEDAEYYQDAASRNCASEQARCRRVSFTSIRDISLDITPDYDLDADTDLQRQELQEQRLSQAPSRSWANRDGQLVARGRMTDYTRGVVHIQDDNGSLRSVAIHELGEDERCFVAAWWKLPLICQLEGGPETPRAFPPMTFTWTASGLCHKPLYFEEKNLERYGHAAPPFVQPVLSGAHFFGSLVTLPYQMGIHPAYECRYDLGDYRPGSCAPWLVPNVPISLRGALLEAGFVTGGFFLLP